MTVTREEFIKFCEEKTDKEFPDDLRITIGGEYIHESSVNGYVYAFDFSENEVRLYTGNGFSWIGTGQEFEKQWTKV